MTISIAIKAERPYSEQKAKAKHSQDTVIVGVHAYSEKELKKIRKDFANANNTNKITRLTRELEKVQSNENLSEETIEDRVEELTSQIEEVTDKQTEDLRAFYKSHILYLKNASLTLNTPEGTKDLLIADTREVKPIESLWAKPSECLSVLVDMYLDSAAFRDSFTQAILTGVFNVDFKALEAKNLSR